MNKFMKPLACILALTIPAIASAEVTSDQHSKDEVLITYIVQDANTNSGRNQLEGQIRRAAERVCGAQHRSGAGSMKQLVSNRSCYQ